MLSRCPRLDTAAAAAGLLLVDLDDVILLHLQRLWGLVIVDPAAVEQEPEEDNSLTVMPGQTSDSAPNCFASSDN